MASSPWTTRGRSSNSTRRRSGPLAPIRNSLQILKMHNADEDMSRKAREMMERQLHHLVRLVDDLLDVSRIMRGRIELRKSRVELRQIVERAVETVGPIMDAHGH